MAGNSERMVSRVLGASILVLSFAVSSCESNPASTELVGGPELADLKSKQLISIVVPQEDPLIVINGVSVNHGGYGSALWFDGKQDEIVYSMTDRGPNVALNCGGV